MEQPLRVDLALRKPENILSKTDLYLSNAERFAVEIRNSSEQYRQFVCTVYLAFKGEFPGRFKERLWCPLLPLFHLEASIKKCSSRL